VARDPIIGALHSSTAVHHVILVDNTLGGHPRLRDVSPLSRITVISNRNQGGLAGAYNTAIRWVRVNHHNTSHILFLDEDSDTTSISSFLSSAETLSLFQDRQVAAVAPAYVDRATGLRGTPICLNRFWYRMLGRNITEPVEVSFLINSMSLWRFEALLDIGAYSTQLKVDHIDTDYCLRAKLRGYKLILNPTVSFLHSIGERRAFHFLGRIMQTGGHSAARRWMIGRNTMLLAKHYGLRFPAFAVLCIGRMVYEMVGITLAETDRRRKLLSILKGGVVGVFTRYDQY
jgi:rhamnosyltransferase